MYLAALAPNMLCMLLVMYFVNLLMLAVPWLWKNKDKEGFRKVFQLLQSVRSSVDTLTSNLTDAGPRLEEVSSELNRLIMQLLDQNVRIGIIGLTKAGKSTFLNALLGKSFLPYSFQPQTANETVIIHDLSTPEGELHCIVNQKKTRLASGQQEVTKKLHQFNEENRNNGETSQKCDKLVLYAPVRFLNSSENQGVKLEISDTPGFGEAGAANIADAVNIAVKELCAFILILNSDYMKSEGELKLLKELVKHHHGLFSELNRVLILVNGRESVYKEKKLQLETATITPDVVPLYVSEYFKKLNFLEKQIPPEKIILFNALWALRCREWRHTSILKRDRKEARTLYDEAMLMLRYFDKDDEADMLINEMSEDNIKTAISLLEPLTKIRDVESLLREMVIENGGLILLESAVADTISIVDNSVLPTITELIDKEQIEAKQNEVKSVEEFNDLLISLMSDSEAISIDLYSSLASSTQAQVTTLRETVQESLTNVASSKLMDGLREIVQLEDRDRVIEEIRRVCDSIPSAALAKIKSEWLTLSNTIRSTAADQIRRAFLDLKTSFLYSLNKINRNNIDFYRLTEEFATTVPLLLVAASDCSDSFVPGVSFVAVDELVLANSPAVQADALVKFIQEGKNRKFRPETRKKCDDGFLFGWGQSCIPYNESVPYDLTVYTPDVRGLKTAYDSEVQFWMSLYDKQVEKYLENVSVSTEQAGKAKLKSIFEKPQQIVAEILQASRSALEMAQHNIAFLKQKKEGLKELREVLADSLRE